MSARPRDSAHRVERGVLIAGILGSSMAFIDGTVVNVALPTLQQALNATAAEVQWVVESYMLTLAALLLLGGALGDRFGRRRVFAAGVAIFALASLVCALAPDIQWLILARGVQGIGSALLTPGSLALIGASIPAERRGRAIGKWSAFSAAAAGIGPVLGGWLIEVLSWRAIFWLNLPIAVATLFITLRYVPESRDPGGRRLDVRGAALATLALAGLVFGLLEAPRLGFEHPIIIGSLLAGVVTLAVFIVVEARSPAPMVPIEVFRSRAFSGANLLTFLLYAALGGSMFLLPFNLVQVHGYTPTQAGAALLPLIVLLSSLSGWAGHLVDRYGARGPLVVGPLIAAMGFGLLTMTGSGGAYWSSYFPGITVLGFGMAVTVAPLTTTVMGALGRERAGLASGINNAVSRAASLLAIALFGLVAYRRFGSSLMQRVELSLPPAVREHLAQERKKLAAASIPSSWPEDLRRAAQEAIHGAFVDAFRLNMALAVGMAVTGALCAWLLIDPQRPRRKPDG